MTTIHMETERVRETSSLLTQWAQEMLSSSDSLRSVAGRLAGAWQGEQAEAFTGNFRSWVKSLESQAEQLQNLATRVSREVDEWVAQDSGSADVWPGISKNLCYGSGGGGGGGGGAGYGDDPEFNWEKPISSVLEELLKGLGETKYVEWQGIGRLINNLIGNQKGGWVGQMDSLGHIVKNPGVQKGVPYVLGVIGDLLKGDRWDRALGSEAIETAANWGMPIVIGGAVGGIIGGVLGAAAGGVGAIPGAVAGAELGAEIGTGIYTAYQGILAAGNIFAGALEISGDQADGVWLQNTLEPLDFGENIGNSLYDAIYNFVTP